MRSEQKQRKNKTIVIVLAVIAAAVIAAALIWWYQSTKPQKKTPAPKNVATETAYVNPLIGLPAKEGSLPARPVIVSTDNDNSDARPQSGISQADIVYEVPIEGGGSRYEPIYYSHMPKQCGPTRSARPYIVDIAREYKAVFVHNGWSPQAKAYLQSNVVPYYAAQNRDDLFYRTNDRFIPHNQYTNLKTVSKQIKKDHYDKKQQIRTFPWLEEKENISGKDASRITCNYYDRINNTYRYDQEKKRYKRYINQEPCRDLNNNRQITCSNILIQKITSKVYEGESERLEIDMTEGGKALLFTRGKVIKGTWSRSGLDAPTVFRTNDGKKMKLSPGRTWIQLADDTVQYSYQ